ncbi:MAG: bacteriohopanetetrol glucosamine biosynthesis glycosyltransferase HpnI [Acidobacteria bacterium]|nr:bacteriohopanetetrol glucosamine biosynthesis glycosyltransferase HpnI [Acidobacteriota bacterium]
MIGFAALALAGAVYYLLVLLATALWNRGPAPVLHYLPPVSILKPVHGRDPRFYEAIRSHAEQDYPEFEILFALNDPQDPALDDIHRLIAEYPRLNIRVMVSPRKAANGKVGLLADLAGQARYPVLLVNDSDIQVEPTYLRRVVAALEQPKVGLVTALYRATSESRASRCEALGIATEFMPGVMVARLLGAADFALGSTMALTRAVLENIGGFGAIESFLADDYQLGQRVARSGYRIAIARTVVETDLGGESWVDTWRHQLRWSRTIRVSRPGGYAGSVIMHVTIWSLLAAVTGAWQIGAACLGIRILGAVAAGGFVLGDRGVLRQWYLIPLRDLWGFAVWAGGLFGHTVVWRGQRLWLSRDGRLHPTEWSGRQRRDLLP